MGGCPEFTRFTTLGGRELSFCKKVGFDLGCLVDGRCTAEEYTAKARRQKAAIMRSNRIARAQTTTTIFNLQK